MRSRLTGYAGILICSGLSLQGLVTAENLRTFPDVEGKNLHGEVVSFPEAFAAKAYHVCLIAFVRQQQNDVDTWLPKLDALVAERENLEFMELPTISRMNAFMRWFIYRGMRSGIENPVSRTRTITLHLDKEPFEKELGIKGEEEIVVVLVNDKGEVRWQSTGRWTQAKADALLETLHADSSKKKPAPEAEAG
ncbi:MAG: hypothetical protein VXW84_00220 [Verrucomicrobiota bacterium]|nr:hypothetical protein [Verrucomicrobiota bacterium]